MNVAVRPPSELSRAHVAILYFLFFCSGFSSLCIEIVFSKYLGFIFGTTAYAVSTVLAAFMAGLAIGNVLGGRLSAKLKNPVRWYGLAELGVAVYCLASPLLFSGLAQLVTALNPMLAANREGSGLLTVLRFALAAVVISPPTVLMGLSFPLLSRRVSMMPGLGQKLSRLYTLNTLGAAAGTFLATYALIAAFGLFGTLVFAALVNVLVCAGAFVVSPNEPEPAAGVPHEPAAVEPAGSVAEEPEAHLPPYRVHLLAFFSGLLTLSFEVVWAHLLALLVGTSTYAFGLVLTIFLVALAIGGVFVSSYLTHLSQRRVQRALAYLLLVVGWSVALTLPVWERASVFFEVAGLFRPDFFGREATRALVTMVLIFVPAMALGVLFPTALMLHGKSGQDVPKRVGITFACNTAGTILGSTLTGFYLLSALGSEWTVRVLAIVSLVPALMLLRAWTSALGKAAVVGATLLGLSILFLRPPWDIERMNTGANVYFAPNFDIYKNRLLYIQEDTHGGFTSVVSDASTRTLMTNGKFEGNDGPERLDQMLFALIPNLYVSKFNHALNIGVGTGQTLAVIHAFGYKSIEAVDISPNIIHAASTLFDSINNRVFKSKKVKTFIRDGRNHLMLNRKPYDVISIELSSVWFASTGNLYSDSFYRLCHKNVTQRGILQQWVQLHHITLEDVATIIRTLKSVFPHVELWFGGHQGILVASKSPLSMPITELDEFRPEVRKVLRDAQILERDDIDRHLLVPAAAMDFVLDRITQDKDRLSTDDNLVLEYSTPKAIAQHDTFEDNLATLRAAVAEWSKR